MYMKISEYSGTKMPIIQDINSLNEDEITDDMIEQAENYTEEYEELFQMYYRNDEKYHWISENHSDWEYSPRDLKFSRPFMDISLGISDKEDNDEIEEIEIEVFQLYSVIRENLKNLTCTKLTMVINVSPILVL